MPEWVFPINPVAASRPRVSRRGAYFVGPYKFFRQNMRKLVPKVLGKRFKPYKSPLHVDLELYVEQPKKTILKDPKPDIDNYIKSIFDSMNTYLWEDDCQIKSVYATKQWAPQGEPGYFNIGVERKRK